MTSILIFNGILVTMRSREEIIPNSYIYIDNGKIVDYGKYDEIPEDYKAAELVINAKGKIVIPALTVAYVNFDYYPIRFTCYSREPHEWYESVELKYLKQYKPEYSEYSLYLTLYNLVNQGICTVCGSIRSLQLNLDKICKLGLNIILAKTLHRESDIRCEIDRVDGLNVKLKRETQGNIGIALSIAQTPILDDEVLNRLSEVLRGRSLKSKLFIEVAKSKEEVSKYKREYQKRPIEYLETLKLLSANTILTHCTWITLREIKLIAKYNSKVILCPETNLSLNEGIPPIMDIVTSNVDYTISLDKGPSYSILDVLKDTLTIHNVLYGSSRSLSAYDILKSVISASNTILGINGTGMVEKGYRANIAIFRVDPRESWVYPLTNIYELMVYGKPKLETLIVNGEVVVDGGQQLIFSEEEIEKYSGKLSELVLSMC